MAVSELEIGTRARRGNLILHRLKNAHLVIDFLAYSADFTGSLEIITNRPVIQDVQVAEHHLGSAKSNGSFVIDDESQGQPVRLQFKQVVAQGEESLV